MGSIKLTIKQEKFCNKYVECGNASEAYRYAYDTSKTIKPETVWRKAKEVLDNGNVSARIEELQKKMEERGMITREMIVAEYAKIAFSSIAHLHKTWITRKEFEELTEEQKASIKSIDTKVRKVISSEGLDVDIEHVKIELYDKLKALDSISRMYGYDAPKKIEVTGKDGEEIIPGKVNIEIVYNKKEDLDLQCKS